MNILFVASVAAVIADPSESRKLYLDALDLPLEAAEGSEYYSSEKVGGCKHFGVWPLAEAAQACFGTGEWPADRTMPQASLEFEVAGRRGGRGRRRRARRAGLRATPPRPD